ncbi:MAG: (d)CMP kinase [Clostridia bacterium]
MTKVINIAVDGPSGSGKSTLAKNIAKHYGIIYIDTGALYRTIGFWIKCNGFESTDIKNIVASLKNIKIEMKFSETVDVFLNGKKVGDEIRTPIASFYASNVSKIPEVRAFLLDLQRDIARANNCVMDGRDIGTVILPNADVKIFLCASDNDRAERRYSELLLKGEKVTFDDVKNDMSWRDDNDKNRKIAPAIKANDAILIDNSGFSADQTLKMAIEIIDKTVKI